MKLFWAQWLKWYEFAIIWLSKLILLSSIFMDVYWVSIWVLPMKVLTVIFHSQNTKFSFDKTNKCLKENKCVNLNLQGANIREFCPIDLHKQHNSSPVPAGKYKSTLRFWILELFCVSHLFCHWNIFRLFSILQWFNLSSILSCQNPFKATQYNKI